MYQTSLLDPVELLLFQLKKNQAAVETARTEINVAGTSNWHQRYEAIYEISQWKKGKRKENAIKSC